jgi:hypothetical protein
MREAPYPVGKCRGSAEVSADVQVEGARCMFNKLGLTQPERFCSRHKHQGKHVKVLA